MSHLDIFIEEQESIDADNQAHQQWIQEQYQDEQPTQTEWEELEKQSLAALNQFQKGLTKVDIKEMADNAIENLLINGNPLQIAEALSGMEMFIEEVKADKRYKDYVREETAKYPKGFTSKSGAKIECIEAGSKYDYSKCNDPELKYFEERLRCANEDVERRQKFLKTVSAAGLDILIDDEIVKIFPPSKSSTSSYKVTLSKGF